MEEIRYIEIVAQYQDMVYRIAFHDCRNSHDAEDVMQTVFMKLYQKNPEFNDEEHLKHWLIRVTMNECKRLIASPWKKRMEFFPEEEREGHSQKTGTDGYERIRERELLEQVFRLPFIIMRSILWLISGTCWGKILPPFRPGFPEQGKN